MTAPPPSASGLRERLAAVEARLERAARAAGRSRAELTLVAVSKTRPAADIAELARLGLRDFGENRWQELEPKAAGLAELALPAAARSGEPALRWHFVGRLQRNKARAVGAVAVAVHSVDRIELCGPLARGAEVAGRPVDVFCQVSLDRDPKRGGAPAEDIPALADAVAANGPALRLVGLMAVAPLDWEPRPAFARLRLLGERVAADHPQARWLSAGMSGDLEAAVAEGATHLRIGSALFGLRA